MTPLVNYSSGVDGAQKIHWVNYQFGSATLGLESV